MRSQTAPLEGEKFFARDLFLPIRNNDTPSLMKRVAPISGVPPYKLHRLPPTLPRLVHPSMTERVHIWNLLQMCHSLRWFPGVGFYTSRQVPHYPGNNENGFALIMFHGFSAVYVSRR